MSVTSLAVAILVVTCLVFTKAESFRPCAIPCRSGFVLDSRLCRCIPTTTSLPAFECPLLNCLAGPRPCLAYKRNAKGCRTCECLEYCPVRRCPSNCPNGVEEFVDDHLCPSCRCRPPAICRSRECSLYCKEGYEIDTRGCPQCQCKPCGDMCEIGCIDGRLLDFNGCQIFCECKPKKECGPVCTNTRKCPNGRLLDENGCPTCQCKPNPECPPLCRLYCQYGNVEDENGCPICKCKPKPCPPVCLIFCEYGNIEDENGCPTCKCKPKPCPPVCEIFCQYGNVLDENGCPTCKCKPRPRCPPVCDIFCEYGNVLDENGCPTCRCMVITT